ncbi:MAG: hypothetical protein MJ252_24785 [archaeon]|nr:hypothetical protein [archaeon]
MTESKTKSIATNSSFIIERIYATEEMDKREMFKKLKEEEEKKEEEKNEEIKEEDDIEEEQKPIEEKKDKKKEKKKEEPIKTKSKKSHKENEDKKSFVNSTNNSKGFKIKKDLAPVKLRNESDEVQREMLREILDILKRKEEPKRNEEELPLIDERRLPYNKKKSFRRSGSQNDYDLRRRKDSLGEDEIDQGVPYPNFKIDEDIQKGMVIELLKLRKNFKNLKDRNDKLDEKNHVLMDLLKETTRGNNPEKNRVNPFFYQPVSLPSIAGAETNETPKKKLNKSQSIPNYDDTSFFGIMKNSINDLDKQLSKFYTNENKKRKNNFFY